MVKTRGNAPGWPSHKGRQISQIENSAPSSRKAANVGWRREDKKIRGEGKRHNPKKQICFLPLPFASKIVQWVEWWSPQRYAHLEPVNVTLFSKRILADKIKDLDIKVILD